MYSDETLTCVDCGRQFTFTTGEQEFFASKGFTNKPNRCTDCRAARKAGRSGGGGGGGGEGYGRRAYDARLLGFIQVSRSRLVRRQEPARHGTLHPSSLVRRASDRAHLLFTRSHEVAAQRPPRRSRRRRGDHQRTVSAESRDCV